MKLREKTTALLDFLSDKTLSFGCGYKVLKGERIGKTGVILRVYDERFTSEDFMNASEKQIKESNWYKIIGHPVMLHDVLAKKEQSFWWSDKLCKGNYPLVSELYSLWEYCEITRSLNDIFSGETIKNEVTGTVLVYVYSKTSEIVNDDEKFKDKNAQNLFSLLWDIFGDEIEKTI